VSRHLNDEQEPGLQRAPGRGSQTQKWGQLHRRLMQEHARIHQEASVAGVNEEEDKWVRVRPMAGEGGRLHTIQLSCRPGVSNP